MLLSSIAAAVGLLATAAHAGSGQITAPAPYTKIAPGQVFNYTYQARGDYCRSSYATTTYLLTELPTFLGPSDVLAEGHFFGRFDYANYPGERPAASDSR